MRATIKRPSPMMELKIPQRLCLHFSTVEWGFGRLGRPRRLVDPPRICQASTVAAQGMVVSGRR